MTCVRLLLLGSGEADVSDTGGAEDFFLEVADACLVAPEFQLSLNRIDLRLESDDLVFRRHLHANIGDVVLGGHVLHDMRERRCGTEDSHELGFGDAGGAWAEFVD